jgi:flagellar basal-body rod protein FlgF
MENVSLVGLSKQVALRRELDIVANNVANMNTTGFKADDIIFNEYLSDAARENSFAKGNDRKVSFVWDRATWYNTDQGELQPTGNPLDVALTGDGMFVVDTGKGERYTRNGSFQINSENQLVNNQGLQIMGEAGPIVLQKSDKNVVIASDGTVSAEGGNRGRLRIVKSDSPKDFVKDGENLYSLRDERTAQPAGRDATISQGFLEKSNVRAVEQMSRLIQVTRAYADLASMLDRLDSSRKERLKDLSNVT